MSRKSRDFKHQSPKDDRSLVEYLSAPTQGFEKGSLQLRDDSGEVVLEPKGLIRFEMDANSRPGRSELTLKSTWKLPDEEELDSGPLLINGVAD